jgi:hypothetical protein
MVGKIGTAHTAGRLAVATTAALLILSGTAAAQLALSGNMPVAGTGIPFGATGLDSPGLSPAPTGIIGPTGNGTACPPVGSSSSGMPGTSAMYDGGGIGAATSPFASSATCGTLSSGGGSSTILTSPLPLGAVSHTGIPLGSFEINNGGVSPSVVVPAPTISAPVSLLPSTTGASMPCSIPGSALSSTPC